MKKTHKERSIPPNDVSQIQGAFCSLSKPMEKSLEM